MEVSSFKRAFRLRRSAASVFCARSVMRLRVCMGACGRTPLTGGMPRSPQARVCETVVEFKKGYALPSSAAERRIWSAIGHPVAYAKRPADTD